MSEKRVLATMGRQEIVARLLEAERERDELRAELKAAYTHARKHLLAVAKQWGSERDIQVQELLFRMKTTAIK